MEYKIVVKERASAHSDSDHQFELVKQWTKELISREFKLDVRKILDDSKVNELGPDSLSVLELLAAVESRFDISIPDDEARKISTFASLVHSIDKHLSTKQRAP